MFADSYTAAPPQADDFLTEPLSTAPPQNVLVHPQIILPYIAGWTLEPDDAIDFNELATSRLMDLEDAIRLWQANVNEKAREALSRIGGVIGQRDASKAAA